MIDNIWLSVCCNGGIIDCLLVGTKKFLTYVVYLLHRNGMEKDGCETIVDIVLQNLLSAKTYLKCVGFGTIEKNMWKSKNYGNCYGTKKSHLNKQTKKDTQFFYLVSILRKILHTMLLS